MSQTKTHKELIEIADRKVNNRVKKLYELYIKCSKFFTFFGGKHDYMIWDEDGVTALQAFNAQDSMGLNVPCRQPFLFKKAIDGKAGLNFIIKQWAEGIKDGTSAMFEFKEAYSWLPDWVWESVEGQAGKKCGFDWYYKEMCNYKEPKDSEVQNTYIIMPPQTNVHGTAFGGQIMAWMDETAAIAATRHCHQPSVTVSVDEVQFTKPIKMGHIVIMKAKVNYTGRSSMEVGVRVCSEDPVTGERQHCLSGYLTFVAVNEDGKPTPVMQVKPVTEEDKRRFEEGKERKKLRLERRAALQRG